MWTDALRSRYVRSLEQQIVELKAEKAEQKAELARLNQCLVPALRAMERERVSGSVPVAVNRILSENKSPKSMDGTKIERMPPVMGWIQARDRAEYLSDSDEAKMERARKEKS